jgi:hypothetical protein
MCFEYFIYHEFIGIVRDRSLTTTLDNIIISIRFANLGH